MTARRSFALFCALVDTAGVILWSIVGRVLVAVVFGVLAAGYAIWYVRLTTTQGAAAVVLGPLSTDPWPSPDDAIVTHAQVLALLPDSVRGDFLPPGERVDTSRTVLGSRIVVGDGELVIGADGITGPCPVNADGEHSRATTTVVGGDGTIARVDRYCGDCGAPEPASVVVDCDCRRARPSERDLTGHRPSCPRHPPRHPQAPEHG